MAAGIGVAYQTRMGRLSRRTLVAAALLGAPPARARSLAGRAVRVVLAGPPGGIIDLGGRAVADALSRALGQPLVLDHRPGAGGMIAAQTVAGAAADGHTLLLTVSEITAIQFLAAVPFDLGRDLVPVATIGEGSALLCVAAALPVASLEELVAFALGHPGELHYLNPGNGTRQHLIPEQINRARGTRLVPVPYRGLPPGVADLVAGRIQLGIVSTALAMQHVDAGALRAVAFLGRRRLPELPGVATMEEQGFGAMHVRSTLTLFGPKGLPAATAAALNRAVSAAIADAEVQRRLQQAHIEPDPSTPQALAARLATEQETLGALLRSLNLRPE